MRVQGIRRPPKVAKALLVALPLVVLSLGCRPEAEGGTPVGRAPGSADATATRHAVAAAMTSAAERSGIGDADATAAAESPAVEDGSGHDDSTAASGNVRGRETESASQSAATSQSAGTSTPPAPPGDYIGLSAQGGAIGATYSLTAVRIGEHDGFTRVVWELSAIGRTPLFEVVERSNTAEPAAGGSVPGAARIEVKLTDTTAIDMGTELPIETPDSPIVRGISILPIPDDSVLVFAVALERPARFEVVALEAGDTPTRLVLDVHTD